MSSENNTTAATVNTNEFKPERKFDFKGKTKSIGVYTNCISRGKGSGNPYLSVIPDDSIATEENKIRFSDIPLVWDAQEFVDEIISPEINRICLAATKTAATKLGIVQPSSDDKAKMDEYKDALLTAFDHPDFQKTFSEEISKLSAGVESMRALADEHKALMTKVSDLSIKVGQGKDEAENAEIQAEFIKISLETAAAFRNLMQAKERRKAKAEQVTEETK